MRRDPARMVERCWKRLVPRDGETRRRTWRREELDVIDTGEWQRIMDDWLRPAQSAVDHLRVPMKIALHLDDVTDPNRVTLTAVFHHG